MRNYVLQWRRGAMSFVLAAACASSLSTSGCNRSSSRDVSIDLSKQATESALQAERKIAARNHSLDQVDEESHSEELAGKVSLPGTRPDVSTNPLAKLLSDRSREIPSGDPFLKSSSNVPPIKQSLTTAHATESKANVSLTQHVDSAQPGDARSVPSGSESPIAKPFPAKEFASAIAAPRPTADVPLAEKAVKKNPFDQFKNTDQVLATSRSFNSSENVTQRPTSVAGNSDDDFSINELGQWKTVGDNLAPKDSFQAFHPSEPLQPRALAGSQPNSHQKRMETLLAKAKIQQARGELHSAYRSVLLAKDIADRYQLVIAASDVDPGVLAPEIAAKIWGARSLEGTKPKALQPELPVIRPKRTRSELHDQAFTTFSQRPDWKLFSIEPRQDALSHRLPQEPSPEVSAEQSSGAITIAANDSLQSLPEREVQQLSVSNTERSTDSFAESSQLVKLVFAQKNERSVEHAVLPKARPMPSNAVPTGTDSFETNTQSPHEHSFAHQDETTLKEIVLETAPMDPDFFSEESFIEVAPQPELSSSTEVTHEKKLSNRSNTKWGVIAFILAVMSTLVGLKLSGGGARRSEVSETDDPKDANDDDQPQLKISKAA